MPMTLRLRYATQITLTGAAIVAAALAVALLSPIFAALTVIFAVAAGVWYLLAIWGRV
jgi:hypothetical protein